MEVVGLVATIIGISEALSDSLGLIKKIQYHLAANDEIRALEDDLRCFDVVLGRLQSVTESFKGTDHRESILRLVQQCERVAGDLTNSLRRFQRLQNGNGPQLYRKHKAALSWMNHRHRISLLRQQLRDIMALFSVYLSTTGLRNDHCRDDVSCAATEASTLVLFQPVSATLTKTRSHQSLDDYPHDSKLTQPKKIPSLWFDQTVTTSLKSGGLLFFNGSPSPLACSCHCHSLLFWQFQGLIKWIGSLSVSTVGSISCRKCVCRMGRRFTATYSCPQWLNLPGLCVSVQHGLRLHINISFPRMTAPDSPLFKHIRLGDLASVQGLLTNGEATVADVYAPWGYSAVTIALFHGQTSIAQFLLQQGASLVVADGSWTFNTRSIFDHFSSSSLINLKVSISDTLHPLTRYFEPTWYRETLKIYKKLNILEALHFSRIHKSILRISCEQSDLAITACKNHINDVDALGRTPLFWAAVFEDESAIRTLLFYGADPMRQDFHSVGPLHVAAITGSISCVKALLGGGASPYQPDTMGYTPIHYAAGAGTVQILAFLLEEAGNVDMENFLGEPLLFVANHTMKEDTARWLIQQGAPMTLSDQWGYDAILDAVVSDAHGVLEVLASQGWNSSKHLNDNKTILHIAALNSNLRTMEILTGFDFGHIDPDTRDDAGYTALDYMRQRRNNESVWEVFCTLILKVEVDYRQSRMPLRYDAKDERADMESIFYDAQEQLA